MFKNTPFNGDLSNCDVSSVTTMASMFDGCPFYGDLSCWNVSNVRDMVFIFFNKYQFPCVDGWVLHPRVDAALAFGIDSLGFPCPVCPLRKAYASSKVPIIGPNGISHRRCGVHPLRK